MKKKRPSPEKELSQLHKYKPTIFVTSYFWCRRNVILASPFLLAFYSVLFLFSNNLSEYQIKVVFVPLVLSLLFSAAVLLLCKFIFKKIESAALIASTIIFICLSYSRIFSMFTAKSIPLRRFTLEREIVVATLVIFTFGLIIYVIIKYKNNLTFVNKIVTFICMILLLFPIFRIVSFELKTGRMFKQSVKKAMPTVQQVKVNGLRPDIYYIMVEEYAGQKSLSEQHGFDNSKFLNSLKNKGFFVASNSTSNYPKTFLSLASSTNLEYLDFLSPKTHGGSSPDQSIVTPYIQNNKVIQFLKQRGYTIVNLGGWWEQTATNPNADINYVLKNGVYPNIDEFTTGFLNTTLAAPIFKQLFNNPNDVSSNPQSNLNRKTIQYGYQTFKDISQLKSPKYVFAHLFFTHDPFVLDASCKPVSEEVTDKKSSWENYRDQLLCANTMLKVLVDEIKSNSKIPPVIIIQADEGPFPMNDPISSDESWVTAGDTAFKEKFPILNAYYFPGIKNTHLYEDITPVNTFRVLFNDYFNTNYLLLPDINYIFQNEDNFYKFTDVTNRVKP